MSANRRHLAAVIFDDEYKADEARLILRRAAGEGLIELGETAVVVKASDGKTHLTQDIDLVEKRKMQGHWLGLVAAVATGVQPLIMVGTAALFVLAERTRHRDAIITRLQPLGGKVAYTNLDPATEQALTDAFEREDA